MSFKTILRICAQALLIQSISAACIGAGLLGYDGFGYGGRGYSRYSCGGWGGYGYDGFGYGAGFEAGAYGYGPGGLTASNSPGLAVVSASPRIPYGVSVLSENVYEGTLGVCGALPFLGTVALEGVLPTAGAGAIAYGCGKGVVTITAEDGYGGLGFGYAGLAEPFGYGFGYRARPFGYRAGFGGYGCGCGAFY